MSKVYHVNDDHFRYRDGVFPDDYDLVATVESEDLERVFYLTNHVESSWTDNSGVEAHSPPHRSTSMGDVVVTEEGTFRCEMIGWKKIA